MRGLGFAATAPSPPPVSLTTARCRLHSAMGAPQAAQNAEPSGTSLRQRGQATPGAGGGADAADRRAFDARVFTYPRTKNSVTSVAIKTESSVSIRAALVVSHQNHDRDVHHHENGKRVAKG